MTVEYNSNVINDEMKQRKCIKLYYDINCVEDEFHLFIVVSFV